jgi:hypothetical protein
VNSNDRVGEACGSAREIGSESALEDTVEAYVFKCLFRITGMIFSFVRRLVAAYALSSVTSLVEWVSGMPGENSS